MWTELIGDLIQAGLTESEIVARLIARGISATQPTINRIKSGEIVNPRYELGEALVSIHKVVCRTKRKNSVLSKGLAA